MAPPAESGQFSSNRGMVVLHSPQYSFPSPPLSSAGLTPAMAAAEARRETRLGAGGDVEGDGGDGAQDSERVRLRNILILRISRKALSVVPQPQQLYLIFIL